MYKYTPEEIENWDLIVEQLTQKAIDGTLDENVIEVEFEELLTPDESERYDGNEIFVEEYINNYDTLNYKKYPNGDFIKNANGKIKDVKLGVKSLLKDKLDNNEIEIEEYNEILDAIAVFDITNKNKYQGKYVEDRSKKFSAMIKEIDSISTLSMLNDNDNDNDNSKPLTLN